MLALLKTFSWQELRHHPWRSAAAVTAVMLGVALAFSVHLINASALAEFSSAVRSTGGQPDLELRSMRGAFDEALYERVATHPLAALAMPVLELQTVARGIDGERRPLRVIGVDALVAGQLAPSLMPQPAAGESLLAALSPGTVFLNPAARPLFGDRVALQAGLTLREARVAGTVSASGPPLAVMDIAAAQDLFGRGGELTRIDVRLHAGADRDAFLRGLALPPELQASEPGDAVQRVDQLSRAYRVNLSVLAGMALFTGGFLVFSVQALSVARRAAQFALLAVLGLTPAQRLRLVAAESALLGLLGSLAGLGLGTLLASLALRLLGGDLGGGYFPGITPTLHWSAASAVAYGLLGVVAAAAGGWLPARMAQRLPPAQTLKGVGGTLQAAHTHWISALLMAAGAGCALLPPVGGIPVAAYVSVGLLLVGGITGLPWVVGKLYDRLAPRVARRPLAMLAVERARRVRETAAVAVSGVVAALSLAVALTVMVSSFRDSVGRWLDVALPADFYLRCTSSSAAADTVFLDAAFVTQAPRIEGVQRVQTQRVRPLLLDAARPPVALLARPLPDPQRALPLVRGPVPVPAGTVPIYVSEAVADLYAAQPGQPFEPLGRALGPGTRFVVAGVWRDYVRQGGAIVMDQADYLRLTADTRVNEMLVWLQPGADAARVQSMLRTLAAQGTGGADPLEMASAAELRAISLRVFDRSFAVTYWLQAVAIAIGLFGVAASFSAQVLARRKEFGVLSHLGLTRRQILAVVAGEGAAWTVVGALAGTALGLAVALVLVHVVNPQSFHWTMDLQVPWLRLAALALAVVAAGTVTAWFAGRAAASHAAVLAVKEDW